MIFTSGRLNNSFTRAVSLRKTPQDLPWLSKGKNNFVSAEPAVVSFTAESFFATLAAPDN